MKKIMYKWVVLQNNEVVRCDVEDESVDVDVEHVFPRANAFADRNLSEMQEYADEYLSDYKYIFKYAEIEIDFTDLVVE